MGKVAKRVVIALAVLLVVLFAASFAFDRYLLGQTFQRVVRDEPNLLPTEEYASAYKSTPVEFRFDGATLRGFVYEAQNPKGFIVFRHGIFSKHTDYLALICAMVDRGYTVFAYDAIGCGISDGDDVKGMAQSARDVAAAVEFVRSEGLAGDLPLVLWGHSWGGYGVAAALATVPNVAACVTMSGYNAPVDVLVDTAVGSMGPIARTQAPTLWLNNKLAFGADADRTAVEGINKAGVPVLVVHGTDDAVVGYETSAIIAQRSQITNPAVTYLVFDRPGKNGHNTYFYTDEADAYLAEKRAELEALAKQHPDGIPADAAASFSAAYDQHRGNVASPDLIDPIDEFLSSALSR